MRTFRCATSLNPKEHGVGRRKRRKGEAMRAEPMLDTVEVENPADYAERVVHPRVKAIRTLRDDPVGSHWTIDLGDAGR